MTHPQRRSRFDSLRDLWMKRVEPTAPDLSLEAREQARAVSSLLLIVAALMLLMAPVPLITTQETAHSMARVGVAGLFVVGHLFVRQGHMRPIAILVVFGGLTVNLFVALSLEGIDALNMLYYQVVFLFFCSAFLSLRLTMIVMTIILVLATTFAFFEDSVTFREVSAGPLSFFALCAPIMLFISYYRSRLDSMRRERIQLSEERYRMISDLISDYAYSVRKNADGDLRIDWATKPAFERVTGHKWDVLLTQGPTAIFHPEDIERFQHDRTAATQGQEVTGEYRVVRPNGDVRIIQQIRCPIVHPQTGTVERIYAVAQDITEERMAQQRTFELALETERRQLLAGFLQSAAHEFRTPLTAIQTAAHIMTRSDDAERRQVKSDQIHAQVSRITLLVDNLSLMARLDSPAELVQHPVQINALLHDLCEEIKTTYSETHTLTYSLDPSVTTIQGDSSLLTDAFKHLLENACRHTPSGTNITVTTQRQDEALHIRIVDDGPGIAADDLPRIFETFWRKDAAHTTPGFGLGLPIAQKIIEQHSGRITADCTEGEGCTFVVVLPIAPL